MLPLLPGNDRAQAGGISERIPVEKGGGTACFYGYADNRGMLRLVDTSISATSGSCSGKATGSVRGSTGTVWAAIHRSMAPGKGTLSTVNVFHASF